MKNRKTLRMAQLSLLIAILLVMAYTPLGYFRTPGLEISFLMVPVTIAAIVLGPTAGAILGLVFGLTSFGTCFGSSTFGATLLGISAVKTFIVCVIARTLAGWLAGIVFKYTKKIKFGIEITSIVAPLLNTLFFMGSLVMFFYNTEFIQGIASTLGATNPIKFVLLFVGIQGLIEAIICFFVSCIISKAVCKFINK